MNPEGRSRRVWELFQAARRLPPEERASFLDRECGGDAELRGEVASLLEHDDDSDDSPLDRAEQVVGAVAAENRALLERFPVPERIGPYRVERAIGSGATGVVLLAAQESPAREVALKLVLASSPTFAETLRRRLEAEKSALARLEHPNIARFYDAGVAAELFGEPLWIAMELVRDALPLTDFCRERRLRPAPVLALFAEVCDAVHYAHQKGVIHRDLKPANLLVDADGRPHVVDFGLAHVIESDGTLTHDGAFLGTMPYASPEQTRGDSHDVRVDVYALGVVLFELLAGRRPFADAEGELIDLVEAIRHAEPPDLATLDARFRGDVAAIVAMALRKDPAARYPSAAALADDVRRYLEDRPIEARTPTGPERAMRFCRRHFAGVLLAAATFLTVLIFGFQQTKIAHAETRRAAEAERFGEEIAVREGQAEEALQFLKDMLTSMDPVLEGRPDVTLLEVVKASIPRLEERATAQTATRIELLLTVGTILTGLEELDDAERLIRLAGVVAEERLATPSVQRLRAHRILGNVLFRRGRLNEAEREYRAAITSANGEDDEARVERLLSRIELGATLIGLGRQPEAINLLEPCLEEMRSRYGLDHRKTRDTENKLAVALGDIGDHNRAERLLRHRLALAEEGSIEAAVTLLNLGSNLLSHARWEEADTCLRRAEDSFRARLGDMHVHTLTARNVRGTWLFRQRRFEEAEAVFRDVLESFVARLGPKHENSLNARHNLATALEQLEREEEAVSHFRAVLELGRRHLGPEHYLVLHSELGIARDLKRRGRIDEEADTHRELLRLYEEVPFVPNITRAKTTLRLVEILLERGQVEEAIPLLDQALDLASSLEETFPAVMTEALVMDVHAQRLLEEDEAWVDAHLRLRHQVLDQVRRGDPFHIEILPDSLFTAGSFAHSQNELPAAVECYQSGLSLLDRRDAPTTLKTAQVLRLLVTALLELGRKDDEVVETLDRAVTAYETVEGATTPKVSRILRRLGLVYYERGELERAEATFTRALRLDLEHRGPADADTRVSLRRLVEFYEATGSPEKASEWQAHVGVPDPPAASDPADGAGAAEEGHEEEGED